jgi:hypothetical protein
MNFATSDDAITCSCTTTLHSAGNFTAMAVAALKALKAASANATVPGPLRQTLNPEPFTLNQEGWQEDGTLSDVRNRQCTAAESS